MKNRAKCKLCGDIIESHSNHDYVSCKCGEIAVDGGPDLFRALSKNWDNFLRIDDEGNEIIVKVKEPADSDVKVPAPTKKDLLKVLDDMIENIEKLPATALINPITHYDFVSALVLLSEIFREDRKDSI